MRASTRTLNTAALVAIALGYGCSTGRPVLRVSLPFLHQDPEWGFKVLLPHAPRAAKPPKAQVDTPTGADGFAARIWVAATPDGIFTVGAAEGQPPDVLPLPALKDEPAVTAAALSGRVRSSKVMSTGSYQGVYYVIDFTRDGAPQREIRQALRSGRRSFLLLVATTPDHPPEAYAGFFDSFEVVARR